VDRPSGFYWWEERAHHVADHAVAVEWKGASGNVLRVDNVKADRTNEPRAVGLTGLVPPQGPTQATVKVGVYQPGEYAFSNVRFGEQSGAPLIQTTGAIVHARAEAPEETVVGTATIQGTKRYSLAATVLANSRPSASETRFMAWDAIVHGARGVSWFGLQYDSESDQQVLEIAGVAAELRGMSDDLLSPESLRAVRASAPAVKSLLLKGPQGLVLVVVNETREQASSVVGIEGMHLVAAQRLGDTCVVPHADNVFQETLEPLAVHIYRIR
jgi:hypothetical protein